jgi:hypothetical protein
VSTDRDVERIVRSWMDEGVTQLPDRVLDLVLDQVPSTPQRRTWWPARRFQTLNTYARFGLVAAAAVLAAAVGIGIYGSSVGHGPESTPTPSPSASASPVSNPLAGTWVAPAVTCAQQTAAVAAAFTAEQMSLAWSCTDVGSAQYSIAFVVSLDQDILRQYADGGLGGTWDYRIVDGQTFQAGDNGQFYITYHYAIDGDNLTIDMISDAMPNASGAELLGEQMVQTAIYETSPFTRQP